MITFADLKRGSCVWIEHHGRHAGVVMASSPDMGIVLYASSRRKPVEDDGHVVPAGNATKYIFGFTQPTYFYYWNIVLLKDARDITRVLSKQCPPGDFHKLEALHVVAVEQEAIRPLQSRPIPIGDASG